MGFRVNAYATVWNVANKGSYSEVEMSTSRRNKQTDKLENDFAHKFVRFYKKAHEKAAGLTSKDRIMITECEVTNRYDKEKKKEYVTFMIYDFEPADSAKPQPKKREPIVDEEDMPF